MPEKRLQKTREAYLVDGEAERLRWRSRAENVAAALKRRAECEWNVIEGDFDLTQLKTTSLFYAKNDA